MTTLVTVFFPGYYFWTEDRQIEAISLTIAVYLGYLIVLGLFIEIYLLHYTWNKITDYNKKHGFQILDENDTQKVTIFGVLGGIFGHPFFLLLSYFWFVTLDLGQEISSNVYQVNRPAFLFVLVFLFMLRFLLYYSIRRIRKETNQDDLYPEFRQFARNNSSSIITIPLVGVILNPPPTEVFSLFLVSVLLPLSFIFGLRILYNNLLDFR